MSPCDENSSGFLKPPCAPRSSVGSRRHAGIASLGPAGFGPEVCTFGPSFPFPPPPTLQSLIPFSMDLVFPFNSLFLDSAYKRDHAVFVFFVPGLLYLLYWQDVLLF